MLTAMDVPVGPWVALGAVLGALLVLATGATVRHLRSRTTGRPATPPPAGGDAAATTGEPVVLLVVDGWEVGEGDRPGGVADRRQPRLPGEVDHLHVLARPSGPEVSPRGWSWSRRCPSTVGSQTAPGKRADPVLASR